MRRRMMIQEGGESYIYAKLVSGGSRLLFKEPLGNDFEVIIEMVYIPPKTNLWQNLFNTPSDKGYKRYIVQQTSPTTYGLSNLSVVVNFTLGSTEKCLFSFKPRQIYKNGILICTNNGCDEINNGIFVTSCVNSIYGKIDIIKGGSLIQKYRLKDIDGVIKYVDELNPDLIDIGDTIYEITNP